MTTLVWPALTIEPVRADWTLNALTQVHESPLTGAVRTQALPGAYWSCVLDYSHARGTNAQLLWGLMARLQGRAGRVAVPLFGNQRPRGVGGGTPLVQGGGQSGTTLVIDGAPASTTGWLLQGDVIQVGDYAYMIAADANTSAGGAATLSIYPQLRSSPSDNAQVKTKACTTRMMLMADQQGTSYAAGGMRPWVLTLREAF
jgi:hypothetical protein